VHADASFVTLGEVFAHPGEEFVDRLIAFDSIKLSTTDMNYMTLTGGIFMVIFHSKNFNIFIGWLFSDV